VAACSTASNISSSSGKGLLRFKEMAGLAKDGAESKSVGISSIINATGDDVTIMPAHGQR
jgi:hypothetical protein